MTTVGASKGGGEKKSGEMESGGMPRVNKSDDGKVLSKPVCPPIKLRCHLPKGGVIPPAHVVMFSGCKDNQKSADVSDTVRR